MTTKYLPKRKGKKSKTGKVLDTQPTIKQRKAVEELVDNGGSIANAMRKAGYSEGTIENPSKLTESKGYAQLMDKYGLTDEFLDKALYDDIENKPGNRYKEMELAHRLRGNLSRQETSGTTVNVAFVNVLPRPKKQ